jgi:hypothetical protein
LSARLLVGAIGLAAALAAGCDQPTQPLEEIVVPRDSLALFQTDSMHYSVKTSGSWYQTTIDVVFTNRTGRTAFFVNCNGATSLRLEKFVEGQWQYVWSPLLPACLSAPITVAAGASYRSTVQVVAGIPGTNTAPHFATTDLTGVFRLVWLNLVYDYQSSLPWGEPLPLDARVSNRFHVIGPDDR